MPVGKIFLNYRRDDSEGYVGRLYDHLVARFPGRVFRDVTSLRPGEDFVNALDREGVNCQVLLAIIGRRWLSSADASGRRRIDNPEDILRREIEHALERKILVIPVLVGGAAVPAMEDLPPELKPLGRRQALPISELDFERDLSRLVDVLAQELQCPPEPVGPHTPPAPDPQPATKPKRLLWIIGSVVATIVVLGVIGAFMEQKPKTSNSFDTGQTPTDVTGPSVTTSQPATAAPQPTDSGVHQTAPAAQPAPTANTAAAAQWQQQLLSTLAGMNTSRMQMASIFGSTPGSLPELQYQARQLLSVLDGYERQVDNFSALLNQGQSDGYLVTATDRAQATALQQVCDIRKQQSAKYRQEAQLVLEYNPYATQYNVLVGELTSVQGEINSLDVRAAGLMQQAGLQ